MSDFGAVYDYALQLEASVPAAALAELEKVRPAVLGLTRKQREEAARAAAHPAPVAAAASDDKRK